MSAWPGYAIQTSAWDRDARSADAPAALDPLGMERRSSLAGKLVELMFYLTTFNSTFAIQTGAFFISGLGGALVLGAGVLTLLIMVFQHEKLPMSIWAVFVLNVCVNISQAANGQIPLLGEGMRSWMFFFFNLLMVCYICRNSAAYHRLLLVLAILLVATVYVGGGLSQTAKEERLALELVGSGFGNSNALGYISGLLCVGLLFWSLRSGRSIHPTLWLPVSVLIWCLAALLLVILLKTVSRGAMLAFAGGISMLAVSILVGRGVRATGVITTFLFIMIGVIIAGTGYQRIFADPLESLERRLGESSVRTRVYQWETLEDLWRTKFVGVGQARAIVTSANIQAHNSFIYCHMAYGGITAYPYLAWMFLLGLRVLRMLRSGQLPWDTRMQVVALFGMSLGAQFLSNHGFMFHSSLVAIAIAEKYTAPFTRRRMRERQYEQQLAAYAQLHSAGSAGGPAVQSGMAYR